MENKRKRIPLLDEIRGFCVSCMVFYHAFIFMYDIFDISIGYEAFKFFEPAQPFFAGAFILISGISSRLSHNNMKRGIKLLLVALALTFVTVVVLPNLGFEDCEIYFGILHLLACSIIIFALLQKPITKIPPVVGAIIFIALTFLFRNFEVDKIGLWGNYVVTVPQSVHEITWLFPLGIQDKGFYSADYFPLIPYLFVFLCGTYFGVYVSRGDVPAFAYKSRIKVFDWLGKNALAVYILHLPAIYVILYFYKWLVSLVA